MGVKVVLKDNLEGNIACSILAIPLTVCEGVRLEVGHCTFH